MPRLDQYPGGALSAADKLLVWDDESGSTRNSTLADLLAFLAGAAPGQLDTIEELAAALGDDENFAATVTAAIAAAEAAAAFNLHDVTDAQRLAGTRGDGVTPLVTGDHVRVTNQANRIERLLDDADASDNENWLIVGPNTFEVIVNDMTFAEPTVNGVPVTSPPQSVGWVKADSGIASSHSLASMEPDVNGGTLTGTPLYYVSADQICYLSINIPARGSLTVYT